LKYYELSAKADHDIGSIFDYTEKEFDFNQAVKYVSEFEPVFQLIAAFLESGKKRDEIKIRLRSFPISSHIIFYRIFKQKIRIVRVLHGSRDLPNIK